MKQPEIPGEIGGQVRPPGAAIGGECVHIAHLNVMSGALSDFGPRPYPARPRATG